MGRKGKNKKVSPPGWYGRIWLEGGEGTFIGFGRAVLLEKIRDHGSISKAAKEMEMSYKHAWKLVESMNRQAGSNCTPMAENSSQTAPKIVRALRLFN